jgi:hypothetical protein
MVVGGLMLGLAGLALLDAAMSGDASGESISYVGLAFFGVPLFWWGLSLRRREDRKKQ